MTEHRPELPPAYVANGFVGLRVGKLALVGGTALVNGFVGEHDIEQFESYAPAPYPVAADVRVGGLWLSQRPDLAVFGEQVYDFSAGELVTRFTFPAKEATAKVEVLTFCSRSQPTLALQEVRVEVDRPCEIVLRAAVDPAGLPGRCLRREAPRPGWDLVDGVMHWESRGGLSSCGVAYYTEFAGEARRKRGFWGHVSAVTTDYTASAAPGKSFALRQIASLVPSIMHAEADMQAVRLAGIARHWGFDELRAENRAAWQELWKGRVRLVGADSKWQDIADAAFFYVHSSVHRSNPLSVAPFAVGLWQNYWGHVFWDAETYIFPPVLLTAPDAARAMLDYRFDRLPAARANAALHGYRGVQFPWESCAHGGEVMVGWGAGIFDEQHISMDVAFAFAQYAHATGDELFMRERAWPVLAGVAEWIASRVRRTDRGYEIRHLAGVDESVYNINNDGYTNMAAVVILREALALAGRLGLPRPRGWEDIERLMFVPVDPETKVILKHDRYRHHGGSYCPEPLVAIFPLGYRPEAEIERATVDVCLSLAPTRGGGPFIPSLLGVFAARKGDRRRAAELFGAAVTDYVVEPFMMFNEVATRPGGPRPTEVTPFITNPGSFLMACLYGLTGLTLGPGEPATWCRFPVVMPEGWEGIEVERIWARGRPARLLARHGDERAGIELG